MTKVLLAFASLIAVIIAFAFYQKITLPFAKIQNHEFQLIIAKTEEQKQIGLSKNTKLDQNEAMLFIFDKPDYYRFWMKDMKFPIDIIFIKDNKIVKIYKNAPILKDPVDDIPIYSSSEPIDKVLETNAGVSENYNFKVGERIEFRNVR